MFPHFREKKNYVISKLKVPQNKMIMKNMAIKETKYNEKPVKIIYSLCGLTQKKNIIN